MKVITMKILADQVSAEDIKKVINESFSDQVIDLEDDEDETIPELEDAVVNGTYEKGEAFRPSCVAYAPSVAADNGDGDDDAADSAYFNDSLGFYSQEMATRIEPLKSCADYLKESISGEIPVVFQFVDRS